MILTLLKIQGHSMEPAIKQGNIVLVSSIPFFFSRSKIGDIVAFRDLNKVMIKRIKRTKGDYFLMEGDNLSDSLKIGWIRRKDIIGKVIFNF